MRRSAGRAAESGFSLIELLVAMFVTLIVSGAIYGLIASGQTAFVREPELAERQQNIRIAMDLIQRDVLLAGQGVPWFGQVFTNVDFATAGACPDLNGCGTTPGTLGFLAAVARASGAGDPSESPDVLEMIATEEQCPFYALCGPEGAANPIANATEIVVREPNDGSPLACLQGPTLLLATNNYNFTILGASGAPGALDCAGGAGNRSFLTPLGAPVGGWAPLTGTTVAELLGTSNPIGNWIAQARVARYEIAPDPADGAPSLWRSTTGLYNADGTPAGRAGANVGTWQLVARGIEDMQVEYLDGNAAGNWANNPTLVGGGVPCAIGNPTPTNCTAAPGEALKLTRQVRVTLSARSMAPNRLQGMMRDGNNIAGTEALRGQLEAVIAPRAAKVGLSIP